MKKSVLLLTFITILVISYTSASAQVATMSSLALRLAQGAANTPTGAAMLTSGGTVAASAAKVHVAVLPIFIQPAQSPVVSPVAVPFSVEATIAPAVTMDQELASFISQERAAKQRSWFRKKK
ncbi:hypothetical protein H7F15_18835 [Pontibacter sp. Tf4]|uniref:hypothetical protein n=1 Tax=Pontibacter sp. Tf4 TaxID=2761620 RepID=UPI0016263A50|nr:hypothetical protein [Pontibacter sp. Tf4]MBB6613103.1 hypothetical protein [Pontibacter sp. Tf4]